MSNTNLLGPGVHVCGHPHKIFFVQRPRHLAKILLFQNAFWTWKVIYDFFQKVSATFSGVFTN